MALPMALPSVPNHPQGCPFGPSSRQAHRQACPRKPPKKVAVCVTIWLQIAGTSGRGRALSSASRITPSSPPIGPQSLPELALTCHAGSRGPPLRKGLEVRTLQNAKPCRVLRRWSTRGGGSEVSNGSKNTLFRPEMVPEWLLLRTMPLPRTPTTEYAVGSEI